MLSAQSGCGLYTIEGQGILKAPMEGVARLGLCLLPLFAELALSTTGFLLIRGLPVRPTRQPLFLAI